MVLGFPCDQFGHQEPGTEQEIAGFCETYYGVTFPMFAKVEVNGDDAHPLYQWLKDEKRGLLGGAINWNFTKFLLGRDGIVLARFGPARSPADLTDDIEKALAAEAETAPVSRCSRPPTGRRRRCRPRFAAWPG